MRLKGKRVVVTQIEAFMGKDIVELFRKEGAELVADNRDLCEPDAAATLIGEAGHVDILVANLAAPMLPSTVVDTDDDAFRAMYETMVFPLHRLVRAVLPQMIARRQGKIIVMGSATAMRGLPNMAAYGSARGAQLAYVKNLGIEVAPHNVNVNAIAQAFVDNPSYFPKSYQQTDEFKARLRATAVGRLAHGWESAALALFLAGDESNFLVGQVFPFAGGWVT